MELVELYTLIEFCKNKRTYIQTHNMPDPDAIGSAYGLQQLFRQLGIETTLCYDGNIDKLSAAKMLKAFNIIMFSKNELTGILSDDDCIICVDSQPYGGNITDLTGIEIAAIDHHPIVEKTLNTEYVFKDIRKTGACCSIIAEYFTLMEKEPNTATATALLHGIKMDTLNFTRGVTDLDIKMYRFLNRLADNSILMQLDTNTLAFSDLKSYSSAISILSLIEIDVAVIYNDRAEGVKFSVRSERPDVDAGKLVSEALFGLGRGGGHATMAGGFVPADVFATLGSYKSNAINERFINAMKTVQQINI